MKTKAFLNTPGIRFLFLTMLTTFISCTSVFFDHPQPVNSKDLKTVPEEIRGKWTEKSKNYEESILIDQTSFKKITAERIHIYKPEADSSGDYKLADGKIYLLNKDSRKGFTYRLSQDTIYYTELSEETYVLSDSVLLRRAKHCYVLNMKKKNWWEVLFIQKNKNGEIYVSYPMSNELMDMKSKYNLMVLDSTRPDTIRFHADFKSGNIEKILNKDGEGMIWTLNLDSTFHSVNK